MQDQMRKILNDEQWARYQKMQQRMRFRPGKQMGKPNGKPANQKPAINNRQKGPVIEKPQSKVLFCLRGRFLRILDTLGTPQPRYQ